MHFKAPLRAISIRDGKFIVQDVYRALKRLEMRFKVTAFKTKREIMHLQRDLKAGIPEEMRKCNA